MGETAYGQYNKVYVAKRIDGVGIIMNTNISVAISEILSVAGV